MDELQAIRMAAIWPVLIGATAVLAARLILWVFGRREPGRPEALACAGVGVLAWLTTGMMATVWDGSPAYWMSYTVGLALVAATLVGTAARRLLDDWRR